MGVLRLVRFISGEIVTVGRHGKLTLLNTELEVLRTIGGQIEDAVRSLVGNSKYIAFGELSGAVRFYNRTSGKGLNVSDTFKKRGCHICITFYRNNATL